MIFSLFIVHNHDTMSSITRVLHTPTWGFFTLRLPYYFSCSTSVVKEAIMTDINDFVQELMTSSDGVGASFFAMRCLLEILQGCLDILKVCFDIISVFLRLSNKNLQMFSSESSSALSNIVNQSRVKFTILFNGYRRMFDHSLSKSKDLSVMLRFLPGVVVQKTMSMQGMAILYGIEPDLLNRLIKFTIEPLKPSPSLYILDEYLSGFLQDRNRSQLYYCDPMLQNISICRLFLSLLDRSNAFR